VPALWIDNRFVYTSDFAYALAVTTSSTNSVTSLVLMRYVHSVLDRSVSIAAFFDLVSLCFDLSIPF
jgi:hypothetical protein